MKLQWKAQRTIYPLTLFYSGQVREEQPLLKKISREARLSDDGLVLFKAKRRRVCSEKMLRVQCSLLRNFREFKRKMWKGRWG